MKRILAAFLALLSISTMAATLTPIQLLSPVGSTSGQVIASTGATTAPAWTTVTLSGLGGLAKANNLSDLVSAATARTNLGLGTSATINTGTSGATIPLLSTANTWTLAQAFTIRPTFNSATPWDSGNLVFATPPAIGGTTPAAGAFTTLSASGAVSGTGFSTYLASPPAIGGTAAGTGAFTTLSASGNDAMLYQNSSAQSLTNNVAATVTGWTKISDRVNANFNAATGVFTAPATGFYHVDCHLTFAIHTPGAVQDAYQAIIVVGGVSQAAGQFNNESITSGNRAVEVHATVAMTAGQTMTISALQGAVATLALSSTAMLNYLSITRVP